MYQLLYTPSARKQLRKLPQRVQQQIKSKIDTLCEDPFTPELDIKKLKGEEYCRLRVGKYRVIYEIAQGVLTIKIIAVGHRKEVYH